MTARLAFALLLLVGFLIWSGMRTIRRKTARLRGGMVIKGRRAMMLGYVWVVVGAGLLLFFILESTLQLWEK